jgi:CxxC-x17-CxxC domain-containing protein
MFKKQARFETKRPAGKGPHKFSRGKFGSEAGRRGPEREKQMHSATCHKCGAECQVPFKPSAGKPVYCRNCYQAMEGPDNARPPRRGSFSRPGFDRHERSGGPAGENNSGIQKELDRINVKLDKILRALEGE